MSTETEALARFYCAINRGDLLAITRDFAPDILRIEPEGFPTAGTYRGIAEVRANVEKGRGTWAEGSCDPEGYRINGDRIVAYLHAKVRLHGSTEWMGGRFADGFVFRDGRIAEFHTFAERSEALAWAGIGSKGTPTGSPVAIQQALPEDAEVLHAIQMRAFEEEGRLSEDRDIPPLTETAADIAHHLRTHTFLVARDGERIVGAARGLVEGDTCRIRGVVVEPDCQGRGIGAVLLRAIEAAHPGIRRFDLTTNTLVPGNVAFYERHGYEVVERTLYKSRIVLAQMSKPGPGADPFDLKRFVEAQAGNYADALEELLAGHKRTHWSWYVFPQVRGLGSSPMSVRYAIGSLEEARAYLAHPLLGPRLLECVEAMNAHAGKRAEDILGEVDAMKFHACVTLFARVSDLGTPCFAALTRFFGGRQHRATLERLAAQRES